MGENARALERGEMYVNSLSAFGPTIQILDGPNITIPDVGLF